jgi:hypothetical protein
LGFEPYNEHLCRLRISGKFYNITIISAYAPTEDKDMALKEQFYEELQKLQDKVPRNDLLIIAGDFNAEVGRESTYRDVVGKYSIHPISSSNGEYLCNHAISNNLTTLSTQFQHKRIHIGTWTSPDGQRLIISQMKKKEQIRWNPENLCNKQKIDQYKQLLHHKLQDKQVQQNINEEWINIKDAILEAATEIITTTQATQRNAWWNEECRDAIKQKNKAPEKCLQRSTRSNQEN